MSSCLSAASGGSTGPTDSSKAHCSQVRPREAACAAVDGRVAVEQVLGKDARHRPAASAFRAETHSTAAAAWARRRPTRCCPRRPRGRARTASSTHAGCNGKRSPCQPMVAPTGCWQAEPAPGPTAEPVPTERAATACEGDDPEPGRLIASARGRPPLAPPCPPPHANGAPSEAWYPP